MESLRGQLLIASPKIVDPNFRRVVVYMAEHTEEGAMGLVLNRPAETTVTEAVPDLEWLAGADDGIWVGGPVSPASVIVLAEFDDPSSAALIVDGDLGFVPAEIKDRDTFAGGVRRVRIFAGHAGWGPGQPSPSSRRTPGSSSPRGGPTSSPRREALWAEVLRRKGRDYSCSRRCRWTPRSIERAVPQRGPQPPLVVVAGHEPRAEAHRVVRGHLQVGEVEAARGEVVERAPTSTLPACGTQWFIDSSIAARPISTASMPAPSVSPA